MIDCHAHLEQPEFNKNREEVIENCRGRLKAIVTCCAHPMDFDLTLKMVRKYSGFVFATASIHPEYIKEVDETNHERFFELIRRNKEDVVGIGETGLDFTIKELEWRKRQAELFSRFIRLAAELSKPLVVHARKAFAEAIEILENLKAKRVLIHFFSARELLCRVLENGWYISVNTALLWSKKIKSVVRDVPLESLVTETDSPWLDPEKLINTPLNVRLVVKKIAKIKNLPFEVVDRVTTNNAIDFFKLNIKA